MNEHRTVVITGVAGYWGTRVAGALLKGSDWHVIGIDGRAPEPAMQGLDFVQAGVGNPALADLFAAEAVDVVCHLDFGEDDQPRESAFEHNVMDAMKLFGACAEASVRKIVLKSSTMVYGAQSENSAFLREQHPLYANKRYGYLRDLVELETFCQAFDKQSPQVKLTILRFGHIVGRQADTPLMRFLRDERALVLLGFDPIMQLIHEDDVVDALVHALGSDASGVFNVAAQPLMPLWRVMWLAGKTPLPVLHPLAHLLVSTLGTRYSPLDLDHLRYRCVGDVARMQNELQFTPRRAADEALRELGSEQRAARVASPPDAREVDELQLRETIARRARRRRSDGKVAPAAPRKAKARRAERAAANGNRRLTTRKEDQHG